MAGRRPAKKHAQSYEAQRHGGLIALDGGPATGHWYWRDEWLRQPPDAWNRAGYEDTGTRVQNPEVALRGYGDARLWRFHPTLRPVPPPADLATPLPIRNCPCGERLLSADRERCGRCLLGRTTESIWLYEKQAALGADRERCREEELRIAVAERPRAAGVVMHRVAIADGPDEEESTPVPTAPPVQPKPPGPKLDATASAAFCWSRLAPHYDH